MSAIRVAVLQLGLGVIQAIKKGIGLDAYAGNLLGEFPRILREGNGPPDFMAVGGSKGIAGVIWLGMKVRK